MWWDRQPEKIQNPGFSIYFSFYLIIIIFSCRLYRSIILVMCNVVYISECGFRSPPHACLCRQPLHVLKRLTSGRVAVALFGRMYIPHPTPSIPHTQIHTEFPVKVLTSLQMIGILMCKSEDSVYLVQVAISGIHCMHMLTCLSIDMEGLRLSYDLVGHIALLVNEYSHSHVTSIPQTCLYSHLSPDHLHRGPITKFAPFYLTINHLSSLSQLWSHWHFTLFLLVPSLTISCKVVHACRRWPHMQMSTAPKYRLVTLIF